MDSATIPFQLCRCSRSQTTNHTSACSHLLSLQIAGSQRPTSDCLQVRTACVIHLGVLEMLSRGRSSRYIARPSSNFLSLLMFSAPALSGSKGLFHQKFMQVGVLIGGDGVLRFSYSCRIPFSFSPSWIAIFARSLLEPHCLLS